MIFRLININSRLRRIIRSVKLRTNKIVARISLCCKGIMRVFSFFFSRCRFYDCLVFYSYVFYDRRGRL